MVGCNQLCTRKELYGADGTKIPILHGEDKHGYQDIETQDRATFFSCCCKTNDRQTLYDVQVLNKKYADHIERNAGYRVVNEYEDEHGRANWLLVNDHIEDDWKP